MCRWTSQTDIKCYVLCVCVYYVCTIVHQIDNEFNYVTTNQVSIILYRRWMTHDTFIKKSVCISYKSYFKIMYNTWV